MTEADAQTETVAWMESLGTRFVAVRFILADGTMWTEKHVADPDTINETIDMAASRKGARAAWWRDIQPDPVGWWVWLFRGDRKARAMPNEEAAEMYARHRG